MNEPHETKLDLAKYQTPELADRVGQLLSLPGRLLTVVASVAGCLLVAWICIPLTFRTRVTDGMLWGLLVYGTVAAITLGLCFGLAIVLNRVLDNLIELFKLSLEVTGQVAQDVAAVQEGRRSFGSKRELFENVHDEVLLPMVERIVHRKSRWLGGITFPFYRRSIGRMMKRVLAAVPEDSAAGNDLRMDAAVTDGPQVGTATKSSLAWLTRVHDYVLGYGHVFRRAALIAILLFLGAALIIAIIPLAVVFVW